MAAASAYEAAHCRVHRGVHPEEESNSRALGPIVNLPVVVAKSGDLPQKLSDRAGDRGGVVLRVEPVNGFITAEPGQLAFC